MKDKAEDPRIARARLSRPEGVTKNATVAVGAGGTMTVLVKGTNEWVCAPGDENKVGDPPMCMNPMGLRWMMDAMQGKSAPTNTAPGMIYMLCGATQRSNFTAKGIKLSGPWSTGAHERLMKIWFLMKIGRKTEFICAGDVEAASVGRPPRRVFCMAAGR
jgi:hypothetical protein